MGSGDLVGSGDMGCRERVGGGNPKDGGGVGSASHWWARLLAVVIRVLRKALGLEAPTYQFIYVDGLFVGLGGNLSGPSQGPSLC